MGPVNCDESIPKMAVCLCSFSTLRNATTVVSCQVTEMCQMLATACLLIHDTRVRLLCCSSSDADNALLCTKIKKRKRKKKGTGPS